MHAALASSLPVVIIGGGDVVISVNQEKIKVKHLCTLYLPYLSLHWFRAEWVATGF